MAYESPVSVPGGFDDRDSSPGLLRPGMWREITGIFLGLAGVFAALCLVAPGEGRSLVGPAGLAVREALNFVFGRYVAWAAPVALVFWAFVVFFSREIQRLGARVAGLTGLLACACALLALPGADDLALRAENFARAGALGAFIVEADGLGLAWQMGTLGAWLALGGGALISFLLATDLLLGPMVRALAAGWGRIAGGLRERREARRAADESPVWRSRIFPVGAELGVGEGAAVALDEPPLPSGGGPSLLPPRPPSPEEPEEKPGTPRSRRRWFFFGGAGSAADPTAAAGAPGGSAAEAMAHGLPGGLKALDPGAEMEDPIEIDEIIDEEPVGEARQPTIVDGLSPLPTAAAPPARPNLSALWEDEDEDADGAEIGLAGIHPAAGEEAPLTPAERRHFDRVGGGVGHAGAAGAPGLTLPRPGALRSGAPEPLAGEDAEDALDDPLFESADEAKRVGIAAATGAVSGGSAAGTETSGAARDSAPARAANNYETYRLPPVELLDDPPRVDSRMTREELLEISQTLERTLLDFGIEAKVIQVTQGPVVTRFELKPAAGVKVSRITALEQDISMALRATNPVRIIAPIPGKAAVGIEVPNARRAGVYLKELISCDEFWAHKSPLAFALGKTIEGEPYFCDLSKMPHLLIAGATGTGKSVCINAIICSILYRMKPDQVRFLFVDPKRVELALYQDIPHLLAPVICDPKRAAGALAWVCEQMEERYQQLLEAGVRSIASYNALAEDPGKSKKTMGKRLQPMSHMVIILDELADLMVVAKADVEESIQRLAQMARAVGIHLIVATQRPSVNVITGVIKANFPARIAFQVSSKADSRVILDMNGAETLLGRGDMLFHPGGAPKPQRIQGCFVSEAEVDRLVENIKSQAAADYVIEEFQPLRDEKGKPLPRPGASLFDGMDGEEDYLEDGGEDGAGASNSKRGTNRVMGALDSSGHFVPHAGGSAWAGDDEIDEALVRAAARLVLETQKGSVSLLQRRLKVGFARAGRLMDMLEEIGIVGPYQGSKPRAILVDPDQYLALMDAQERAAAAEGRAAAAPEDMEEEEDRERGEG